MQKVLAELKEETRPKISQKNIEEGDISSLVKSKIVALTGRYRGKQNKVQILDQVTKEAWKRRKKKLANADWRMQKKKSLDM